MVGEMSRLIVLHANLPRATPRLLANGEPTMWELICHHTYKLAWLAADLSPLYDNDGIPDKAMIDHDFLEDGVAPGSGAVRFPRMWCRIRVPPGKASHPLGGIKVEVTARRSLPTSCQTLIAAHESFTFKTVGQYLFALFRGKFKLAAWGNSDGLDSFADAVDFQLHPLSFYAEIGCRYVIQCPVVAKLIRFWNSVSGSLSIDDVRIFHICGAEQ
jgi:hypothetical protein